MQSYGWIVAILLVTLQGLVLAASDLQETSSTYPRNLTQASSQGALPPRHSTEYLIAHLHRFRSRLSGCPPIRPINREGCPRGWKRSTQNGTRSCSLPDSDNISPCSTQNPRVLSFETNLEPVNDVYCKGLKLNCLGSIVFPADTEKLDLNQNLLSNGDHLKQTLRYLPLLKHIDISSNDFQRLPESLFQYNLALEEVKFQRNFISYIPEDTFFFNPNLTAVYFQGNGLQILPWFLFTMNYKLKIADFSNNKLTDFPMDLFYDNSLLETTDFSNNLFNQISEETFIPNPFLRDVDLSANNLSSIPALLFEHNTELMTLKLSHNQIRSLSAAFLRNCLDLQHLSLSFNLLEDLPIGWLQNNTKLRYLDLRGNRLSHISDNLFNNHPLLTLLNGNNFDPSSAEYNPNNWFPHSTGRIQNSTKIQRLPIRFG